MNRVTVSHFLRCSACVLLGTSVIGSAQAGWPWKSRTSKDNCGEPPVSEAPNCTVPQQRCAPAPPTAPPTSPPAAPPAAPPSSPQVPAVYQAPQMGGEVSGASQSIGIRGFGIRFPEFNLQFPTIQMPSLVRYQRGSEMYFDSARSPQIQGVAPIPAQHVPGGYAIPVAAGAPSAPAAPSSSPPVAPPSTTPQKSCAPPASRCGAQYGPPKVPGYSETQYEDGQYAESELEQTRRELAAYREELAQLREVLVEIRNAGRSNSNTPMSSSPRSPEVEDEDEPDRRRADNRVDELPSTRTLRSTRNRIPRDPVTEIQPARFERQPAGAEEPALQDEASRPARPSQQKSRKLRPRDLDELNNATIYENDLSRPVQITSPSASPISRPAASRSEPMRDPVAQKPIRQSKQRKTDVTDDSRSPGN